MQGLCHDDFSSSKRVHLALGFIDMRKGIDGLAMLVHPLKRQDASRVALNALATATSAAPSTALSRTSPAVSSASLMRSSIAGHTDHSSNLCEICGFPGPISGTRRNAFKIRSSAVADANAIVDCPC